MIKSENSNIKTIPVLDSLRAFAALSVCLFHFICTVVGFTSNEYLLRFFSFGKYGVEMFFVISGFIIPWAMYHGRYEIKNFFTFTAKRLIRLEPPYLVSLFLAVLITYIRMLSPHYNGVDTTPGLKQILLHFGYLIPFFEGEKWIRQVYWTLAIEFQYYISIGLLFPLIAAKNAVARILVFIVFLLGPLLTDKSFLPFYLPVFLLGILLFLYKSKNIKESELYIFSVLSCIVIYVFHDTATLGFALVTYLIILKFEFFTSRIGEFLGKISYSVYLFHGLTGMVFLNYMAHTAHSGLLKFIFLLVALAITIIFSYFIYKFIEAPSKKLSSAIRYKKRKET